MGVGVFEADLAGLSVHPGVRTSHLTAEERESPCLFLAIACSSHRSFSPLAAAPSTTGYSRPQRGRASSSP